MTPLEVVQTFYEALGRLDDSMQWTEAEGFPYYAGTWIGPQAVLDNLLIPLGRDWTEFSATAETFTVEGAVVVAFGTYSGIFKRSGAALAAPFAHRWEITGNKATNFRQYTDTALVRAATE